MADLLISIVTSDIFGRLLQICMVVGVIALCKFSFEYDKERNER